MDDASDDFEVSLTEPRLLRATVTILKVVAVLYLALVVYGVVQAYGRQADAYRDYLLTRTYVKGAAPFVAEPTLLPLLPELGRGVLTSLVVFAGGDVVRLLLALRAIALRTRRELGELSTRVHYQTGGGQTAGGQTGGGRTGGGRPGGATSPDTAPTV